MALVTRNEAWTRLATYPGLFQLGSQSPFLPFLLLEVFTIVVYATISITLLCDSQSPLANGTHSWCFLMYWECSWTRDMWQAKCNWRSKRLPWSFKTLRGPTRCQCWTSHIFTCMDSGYFNLSGLQHWWEIRVCNVMLQCSSNCGWHCHCELCGSWNLLQYWNAS